MVTIKNQILKYIYRKKLKWSTTYLFNTRGDNNGELKVINKLHKANKNKQ